MAPSQCPPQPQLPQECAHLTMQALPQAASVSQNSSFFSETERSARPVARPADKCGGRGIRQEWPCASRQSPASRPPCLPAAVHWSGRACLCLLAKSSQGWGVAKDPRSQWTCQCRSGREGTERRQPGYRCSPCVLKNALPTVPSAGEWSSPARGY